ncbi:MAG: DUF885 domain-containing protein [Phycisphaerales bacterium]|nr:DUF885 domain-containing protein [Phycisphaerales bacterium]
MVNPHAVLGRLLVGTLFLSSAAAGAQPASPGAPAASPELTAAPAGRSAVLWGLMNDLLDAELRRGLESGLQFGDERFLDVLPDASPAGVAAWDAVLDGFRERLAAIDRESLGDEDRVDADLLDDSFQTERAGRRFHAEQMPVTAISGPQFWLPQAALTLPFRTPWHFESYVRTLERIPALLAQQTEQMRLGMAAGRTRPRSIVGKSLPVARALVVKDAETSPFFAPLAALPRDDPMRARALAAVRGGVIPAFAAFADFLEHQYIPACRESTAASDGPDGPAWYDYRLRAETTTTMTAREVHDLGLSEVARLRDEMMRVIAETGFRPARMLTGDDLFAAFVVHLRNDPRFYCKTPEELLTRYRDICKRIDGQLPALFGTLPRNSYGVKEIPAFAAPTSPTAYYYVGTLRGGVAGNFMANTHRLDQRPLYEATALAMHEAVPGHHLQIALAQEMTGRHPLRSTRGYTAFVEGWALYAEGLGLEMNANATEPPRSGGVPRGLYADPYDDFGRLNMEMWRALRLVVDTGLHREGWTRQQAIDYMAKNSALARLNIENEVDRYIGWPGQACAYKIGQLKILELRRRAESALGPKFDLRAFHDAVLLAGPLPLPVLERRIDRWIDGERGR